jgi:predicted ferric reductase
VTFLSLEPACRSFVRSGPAFVIRGKVISFLLLLSPEGRMSVTTRSVMVSVTSLLPPARRVGPASVAALAAGLAVLWCVVGPSDVGWASFVGQLAGAEAVLLMSLAVVLISVLPAVETWFDGLDRTAIWHRRLSIIGLLLLVPHVVMASGHHGPMPAGAVPGRGGPYTAGGPGGGWGGPLAQIGVWGLVALAVWAILPRWRALLPWWREDLARAGAALAGVAGMRYVGQAVRRVFGGYERWRSVHRLTGLFLAAGFVHGLLDATTFGSALLRWTYVAIGGTGLAFYVYRETVARFFLPLHDYEVADVTTAGPGLTELALRPVGHPMHFVPGQFAMVFLESANGWRRHPFTISGASAGGVLRFTIKALGDDTSTLADVLRPGMPAIVGGPHGRFLRSRGTARQVWIAGGIGVTPFLSWLRSLDQHPLTARVDFFYSTQGPAPFAAEITAIASAHDNLRVHLHDSVSSGLLTADEVLTAVSGEDPRDLSVFLCGPAPMVDSFVGRFRAVGVSSRNIHREHFHWR